MIDKRTVNMVLDQVSLAHDALKDALLLDFDEDGRLLFSERLMIATVALLRALIKLAN